MKCITKPSEMPHKPSGRWEVGGREVGGRGCGMKREKLSFLKMWGVWNKNCTRRSKIIPMHFINRIHLTGIAQSKISVKKNTVHVEFLEYY